MPPNLPKKENEIMHTSTVQQQLSHELLIALPQVNAFVKLYDDGNTVPFIARYRKEATQGLDDTQLRQLETRLLYHRELGVRREAILKKLRALKKLTPELERELFKASNKTLLEELYLPFKIKRTSKAQLALAAGLDKLADKLWNTKVESPLTTARNYRTQHKEFSTAALVLAGAQEIQMERIASNAYLLEALRKSLFSSAYIESKVVKSKLSQALKFKDYHQYNERILKIPSHRVLALLRGGVETNNKRTLIRKQE